MDSASTSQPRSVGQLSLKQPASVSRSTLRNTDRDKEVFLTKTERKLLLFFWGNIGLAFSTDQVLETVWGTHYASTIVMQYVHRLRNRLHKLESNHHIATVRDQDKRSQAYMYIIGGSDGYAGE